MGDRYYTKEEVEKIIQKVIESKGFVGDRFSREDILAIAKDLNLDPKFVLAELEKADEVLEFEQAKKMWRKKKKNEFFQHLAVYIVTNISFFLIMLIFQPENVEIPIIFALLWFIAIVANFIESFFPSEDKVEKGALKLMKGRKWRSKVINIIDTFLNRLTK
ncbi:MAG: 2TM domain-containing protein [Candidatus Kapaibacteriota bacterium]